MERKDQTINQRPAVSQFILPYPPSANHYWRRIGTKTLISREGRAYRQDVLARLGQQIPLTCALGVTIEAYPPDRRRRDLDNILKALLDALQGQVFLDDSQIDFLSVIRKCPTPQGKVVVKIWQLARRKI